MLPLEKILPSFLRNIKMSIQEIILVVIFVIYIISPINTPDAVSRLVESHLGLASIFAVTVFLFIYTNPILGILYIFVAYELIRRSDKVRPMNISSHGKFLPMTIPLTRPNMTVMNTNMNINSRNESQVTPALISSSLEEETIKSLSPIGESKSVNFVETEFKPTTGNIYNASSI